MKIIAEIGSNFKTHDDCIRSIMAAKASGADVVKFQHFTGRDLYGPLYAGDRHLLVELGSLATEAKLQGIEIMCTAFSEHGYDYVDNFVSRHKIASAEITDKDIIRKVNSFRKPVLLSTGGATFDDIESALSGLKDCPVTIMYCVTDYPARVVDFRRLEEMKEHFGSGYQYGYSDHSADVLNVPVLARVHGAVIIEKHVNFTEHTDTPDAAHSLSGKEFSMMVKHLKGDLSPAETFIPCTWQRRHTVLSDGTQGYYRPSS